MTVPNGSPIDQTEHASPADERDLWRLWQRQGDFTARGVLIERYLRLPRAIALRVLKEGNFTSDLDRRDLIQAATIAMIESMDRFDPDAGVSFATYAGKRLRGAVLDDIDGASDLRAQIALTRDLRRERVSSISGSADLADRLKRVVEIAVGVAVGILLEDTGMFVNEESPQAPYTAGDLAVLKANLKTVVEGLPAQERAVMRYHYYHDLSFAHIADVMGLTRARISQVHAKALSLVRLRYAESGQYDELA